MVALKRHSSVDYKAITGNKKADFRSYLQESRRGSEALLQRD
jgi:hypothetical protein